MKPIWKPAIVALAAAGTLGGCAVYQPAPPAYAAAPVYREVPAQRVYEQPAPVYVQPAPVYAPPITFGLDFGFWGGHGHRRW